MRRAVFVDRDGVICRNRADHVKSWEEFIFLPGALEALVRLARSRLSIVVITNQAAINRGIVAAEIVEGINARMIETVIAAGGRIDEALYCPHRPDEHCLCRKPQPGMLLTAAKDLGLDLTLSYLIGDAETDMQVGQSVGCQCYMVLTGRGRREFFRSLIDGKLNFRVTWNLGTAVSAVLRQERRMAWESPRFVLGERSGR